MRPTSRSWAVLALAGLLVMFGVFINRPEPVIGAAGLGIWVIGLQYRFVRATAGTVPRLTIEQTSSRDRVVKGDTFVVELSVASEVPVDIPVSVAPSTPVSVTDATGTSRQCRLEPGEREATITFTATSDIAGSVKFEAPEMTLSDGAGLFEQTVSLGSPLEVQIEANPPRDLHIGEGGERVPVGYGEHTSKGVAEGLEPVELREYSPGDELRRIDWKATARLGYPHIRKYERETPRQVAIVVDHRATMEGGPAHGRKLDYARDVALLFINDARVHNDPLALYTVGDEGMTGTEKFATGSNHYGRIRRQVTELTTPSTPEDVESKTYSDTTHTAQARRLAETLSAKTSAFEQTLYPYVATRDAYIQRYDSRPLFSTIRSNLAEFRKAKWTILITDDTERAELHDTVTLARQAEGHVGVFLTPSVLFETDTTDDLETRYRRYRDFEEYRQTLSRMNEVTAFEVGPGPRIESLLSTSRAVRSSNPRAAKSSENSFQEIK